MSVIKIFVLNLADLNLPKMAIKHRVRQLFFLLILTVFSTQHGFSQCFQIESVLVDACGADEGFNEMVRFKIGAADLNTSNMNVNWPSNSWQNLIQNSVTASKVAALNADITAAGGCGHLVEPTAGVLPANATVIIVTSYQLDTALNSFGALSDTIYILFQNNPSITMGHFGNYGSSAIRILTISFGSCSDTVTYNRSLLVTPTGTNAAADGATVVYTPDGTATYINNGCSAPVQPFTVDAGPNTLNACTGTVLNLTGTAQGQQTVTWSAPSGTFSSPNTLATNYTINAAPGSTVTLTLTIANSCGATVTDTILLTVSNGSVPNFNTTLALCAGSTAPVLNTTSPNGITGTWNPAVINTTIGGSYIFTPTAGQCAASVTLVVSINTSITPNFTPTLGVCAGSTPPALNTTSPNGITGTWNPAVINTTTAGNYTFTPTAGQCASSFIMTVTINPNVTPNFATTLALCSGSTAPALNTTSPNGITGTWNPAAINNTIGGNYTFTPTAGQCAVPVTLAVTISNTITPNFPTTLSLCSTATTTPVLNTTSPNGITGTWNPSVISNVDNSSYVFTPNPGQCAVPVTLVVTVAGSIIPDFSTTLSLCTGATSPALNTTSPNGITGTWNPAVISNTNGGNYVFTPTAGQCAVPVTLVVTIGSSVTPNFATSLSLCTGSTAPALNTTSPNGITGTWSPSVISNTTGGNYVFTPTAGQCAGTATLVVTVSNSITPDFATALTLCGTDTIPALNTTSPNGITGTWSPSVISSTASANYVFTPAAGQCAVNIILAVTITTSKIPDFPAVLQICQGGILSIPVLATTSPNGITGTWNPAVITTAGTYIFTPDNGQCATSFSLDFSFYTINFDLEAKCVSGKYIIQSTPAEGSFDPADVNYEWNDAAGNTIGSDEDSLNVTDLLNATAAVETFPITYTLTVRTHEGCELTQPLTIYGVFCSIPKGISPNGDEKNDEFDLSGLGVKEIVIFNRYGTKVYSRLNYTKEWKGQSDNGHELPDATYFYVITKDNGESVTGWVYINR